MSAIVASLLLGVSAGCRAFTPLAVTAWAARLGLLHVEGSWIGFLASAPAAWILTLLALGELVSDKLPKTPSRKIPPAFAARLVSGGLVGTAVGVSLGSSVPGAVAGVVGAVLGTLGGAAARARLAQAFGRDLPAALVEDAFTVGLALLSMRALG